MNAPLLPLKPIERLGWLRHFDSIRCRKGFDGFERGQRYPMAVSTIKAQTAIGGRLFSGCELMIIVTCSPGNGWRHRFVAEPKANHIIIHSFLFFVEHFAIPQIPDVAALNPKGFDTYKSRLRALES